MSVRKNQSREENEQLNSFKENLFGNLKDSLNINWTGIDVPSVPQILTVRRSVVRRVYFRLKLKSLKPEA